MSRDIEYYFSLHSPWTYLGHTLFREIAAKHGGHIVYRPVPLGSVFNETGGLPLPKRHPVRQRYRLVELQRWRARRGVKLILQPQHFPYDPSLADRMVIAIQQGGGDPGAFMGEVMAALWARDEDLSQADPIIALADAAGHDGKALREAAESEDILDLYRGNDFARSRGRCVRGAELCARRRGVLGAGPAGTARFGARIGTPALYAGRRRLRAHSPRAGSRRLSRRSQCLATRR